MNEFDQSICIMCTNLWSKNIGIFNVIDGKKSTTLNLHAHTQTQAIFLNEMGDNQMIGLLWLRE